MNYLYAAAALFIGLSLGYFAGHYNGVKDGRAESHLENVEKAVEYNDKKSIIRNNRPNAAGVVDSLRKGTF